eukprot:5718822-Prymnesium_polylepis.2
MSMHSGGSHCSTGWWRSVITAWLCTCSLTANNCFCDCIRSTCDDITPQKSRDALSTSLHVGTCRLGPVAPLAPDARNVLRSTGSRRARASRGRGRLCDTATSEPRDAPRDTTASDPCDAPRDAVPTGQTPPTAWTITCERAALSSLATRGARP